MSEFELNTKQTEAANLNEVSSKLIELGFMVYRPEADIGGWVREQRMRRSTISADRVKKLEGLKRWSCDPHLDDQLEKLAALKSFADENVIAALRQETEYDGLKIGRFAHNCKATKKGGGRSKSGLHPIIEKELLKIPGWTW